MPLHQWRSDAQDIQNRPAWKGEASALIGWAMWATDGLYYLTDLDRAVVVPQPSGDHPWHVVDLAHARWAASSAVGAIDLCAAALARRYGVGPVVRKSGKVIEFDLGDALEAAQSGKLTGAAASWAQAVSADPDVELLTAIRHPTTHSRLRRHFYRGGGGSQRTYLIVYDAAGRMIEVGEIVELARVTATRVVENVLNLIASGTL